MMALWLSSRTVYIMAWRQKNSNSKDPYIRRVSSRSRTTAHTGEYVVGILRSELDEPKNLPAPFLDLITQISQARHGYDTGSLTKNQYATVLRGLRIVGPDGTEWTMGATSGRWYCRPVGGAWVPSTPPSELSLATDDLSPSMQSGISSSSIAQQGIADEDLFAHLDAVLRSGDFESGASYKASDPVELYPEVTGQASTSGPLVFESANVSIDEDGAWGTEFAAGDAGAAFSEAPLLDFDVENNESSNAWQAWGIDPAQS